MSLGAEVITPTGRSPLSIGLRHPESVSPYQPWDVVDRRDRMAEVRQDLRGCQEFYCKQVVLCGEWRRVDALTAAASSQVLIDVMVKRNQ